MDSTTTGKNTCSGRKRKVVPIGASEEQVLASNDGIEEKEGGENNSADDFEDNPSCVRKGVKLNEKGAYTSDSNRAMTVVSTQLGGQEIIIGDDVCPEQQMKRNVKEKKNTRGKLPTYQHLETRSSPSTLVETMQQLKAKDMNEAQLRTIHYIGFGSLLNLELKKQPLSLGAWLVDHFNPHKCSIEFADGRSIEIRDKDVNRCFGIPLGKEAVEIKGQNENKNVIDKWRAQFDKQYAALRPSHVKTAMLGCNDGGLEFVQNFLVLFDTTMVNSQQSGGVYQGLVRSIESVDSVKNKNWCQYVITCLVRRKLKFGLEKKGSFGGPVLFLVLLNIDLVVHQGQRQVHRAIPVFIGWDDTTLSAREKSEMVSGGFGKGRIEPPLEVTDAISLEHLVEVTHLPLVPKEDYLDDIIKAAVELSGAMKAFVEKINQIPMVLRKEPPMISAYELSKTILGRGIPCSFGASSSVGSQVEQVFTQGTQSEYKDATFLLNMKKIEEAINLRDALLAERNKWPSFALGVEGVDQQIKDPVNDVIADIVQQERRNGVDLIDETMVECGEKHVVQLDIDKDIDEDYGIDGSDDILDEGGEANNGVETTASDCLDIGLSVLKKDGNVVDKGKALYTESVENFKTPRPRRYVKPSIADTSPYVSRFIDPENRNTKEQSMVVNVVKALKNKKILFENVNESVMSAGKFVLWTEECQSILDKFVAASVIDVWAKRLNYEEKKRSNMSPCIYFVPTFVTTTAICNTAGKTFEERFMHFSLHFYEGAADVEIELDKIDMTMFPILDKGHYYVICIKMKMGVAEIIDNSKSRESDDGRVYKGVFDELMRMFCKLIEEECGNKIANRMSKITVAKVLKLDWKDDKERNDSGVYAMRHMETYKGDVSWKCGFKASSKKNIYSLRMKYLHCILTSELNGEKEKLIRAFKDGPEPINGEPNGRLCLA